MADDEALKMGGMNAFLATLFGEAVSPECRLSIFACPPARSRLCASIEEALAQARTLSATQNVYFGVGLVGGHVSGRGTLQDIIAIPGLWADIDLIAPFRQQKALPSSLEEAQALLTRLPFAPTLVVHSGYGLQPYWIFKEPWIFESPEDRVKAQALTRGWHGLLCGYAAQLGWSMENLGDLTRVLRLPGTFNRKLPDPVHVRVIGEYPVRRYNPQDFEPFAEVLSPEVHRSELLLRPDAQPPAELFAQALSDAPLFAQTWNGQRTDLSDSSQSGYDLSLATIAALRGWSDQQIADLIVAARRKHAAHPAKALREDYMRKTIQAARRSTEGQSGEGVDLTCLISKEDEEDALCETAPFITKVLENPGLLRPLPRLRTTFAALDQALNGGLVRGGMYCLVGLTGQGKSTFAANLARRMATEGTSALLVTLEDDALPTARKLVAQVSGLPVRTIEDAETLGPLLGADLEAIHKAIAALKRLPLRIDAQTYDLARLERLIAVLTKRGVQAAIIDQSSWLSLLGVQNDFEKASETSRRLKQLAKRLRIALVILVQINRAGAWSKRTGQDLELFHIRDSGRWEQDADGVLIIQGSDETGMRLDLKKHRHGPRELRVTLAYALEAARVDDHPEHTEPEALKDRARKDAKPERPKWDAERFVEEFVNTEQRGLARILEAASEQGLSEKRAKRLLAVSLERGLLHVGRDPVTGKRYYSTQPMEEAKSAKDGILTALQGSSLFPVAEHDRCWEFGGHEIEHGNHIPDAAIPARFAPDRREDAVEPFHERVGDAVVPMRQNA